MFRIDDTGKWNGTNRSEIQEYLLIFRVVQTKHTPAKHVFQKNIQNMSCYTKVSNLHTSAKAFCLDSVRKGPSN